MNIVTRKRYRPVQPPLIGSHTGRVHASLSSRLLGRTNVVRETASHRAQLILGVKLDGRRPAGGLAAAAVERLLSGGSPPRT